MKKKAASKASKKYTRKLSITYFVLGVICVIVILATFLVLTKPKSAAHTVQDSSNAYSNK